MRTAIAALATCAFAGVPGLVCGADPGLSVSADHEAPFAFTGVLHQVVVAVDGVAHLDPEAEAEHAVITQ